MMGQGHPAFIWIAYGVLVLMNVVDLVYTNEALSYGVREGNPFMERIYLDFGIQGVAVVKGISLGLLFCLIPLFKRYKIAEPIFYFAVFVYTCLTFYHLWAYVNVVRGLSEGFT